jgi:hypothetical protein
MEGDNCTAQPHIGEPLVQTVEEIGSPRAPGLGQQAAARIGSLGQVGVPEVAVQPATELKAVVGLQSR